MPHKPGVKHILKNAELTGTVTDSSTATRSGTNTFSGTVALNGATSLDVPITLKTYAVAGLPAAASYTGAIVYCSDGAAGNPCLAISDGTNWLRCDTLATAASS